MNDLVSSPQKPNPRLSWGIVALIAAGVLIAGGVVGLLGRRTGPSTPPRTGPEAPDVSMTSIPPTASPSPEADAKTQALEQVGTSSELSDIEGDLGQTDLTGLDAELADMEKELAP